MMRDDHLLLDSSSAALSGYPAARHHAEALFFKRSFSATPEWIMRHWLEPELRQRWLPLPSQARMVPIAQSFPTSLRATVTDGIHSVHLELMLEDDGPLTALHLSITPVEPLTQAMLINAGYADRWEELLYVLTDLLEQ